MEANGGQPARSAKRAGSHGRKLEYDSGLAVQQVDFCHFEQVNGDVAIP
jgi:hypothetical protein